MHSPCLTGITSVDEFANRKWSSCSLSKLLRINSELPITDSYQSLFTFIIITTKIAIVHNVHKINSALFAKLFVFFAVKYGILQSSMVYF